MAQHNIKRKNYRKGNHYTMHMLMYYSHILTDVYITRMHHDTDNIYTYLIEDFRFWGCQFGKCSTDTALLQYFDLSNECGIVVNCGPSLKEGSLSASICALLMFSVSEG